MTYDVAVKDNTGSVQKIRQLERWEKEKRDDHGWSLPQDIMDMMVEMCDHRHCPIKIFNWCKRIKQIKRQTKGIVLYVDRLAYDWMLDKITDALMGYFKTRAIALVCEGMPVKYLQEPDRKERTHEGLEILQNAIKRF